MRKIINKAGQETIENFVRENLSGRISEETVQSYIATAESRMKIYGGLPSLEISMCFSLTGESEYLELEESEVGYEDCIMESAEELAGIFGQEIRTRLQGAGDEKRLAESDGRREATVRASYDGYLFSVTAVRSSPDGETGFYEVKCLGLDRPDLQDPPA